MRAIFQKITGLLIIVLLCSCNFPGSGQTLSEQTDIPNTAPATTTVEQPQDGQPVDCAFMWAIDPLPELSESFDQALKESLPNAEGYAEAFGENCVTEAGDIARFLAMETDYHITLAVDDLNDKQILGKLVEDVMDVLAEFPTEDTPGPQPGYIGITFEAPNDISRLWVMRTDAEVALDNGLQGEELFIALQDK